MGRSGHGRSTVTLRRLPQLSPLTISILNETVAGSRSADKALDEVEAWLKQAREAQREGKTHHRADARRGVYS